MIPTGMMLDELYDVLECHSDPEMKLRVLRRLNYEYFELCSEAPWDGLRCATPETLDFETDATTGLVLPSDLLGIEMVIDEDEDPTIVFHEKGRAYSTIDEWGYRYYLKNVTRANLFDGTDLVLEKGGSSFTSALLTADGEAVSGEYVQFADQAGMYEISSDTTPFTFTPKYYGPKLSRADFVIRPWQSTKKMVLIDADEDALVDRDVIMYFWRMPSPLYRAEDVILLPHVEILKLRVLRGMPEAKARFPVSESMLKAALRKALKANPDFSRQLNPLDKHGKTLGVVDSAFQTR